jgi:hypothetical protein
LRSPFAGIGPADIHIRGPRSLPLVTGGAAPFANGVFGFAPPANADKPSVVFCELALWQIDQRQQPNLKRDFRRNAFLLTRLLANLGVVSRSPVLERFGSPVKAGDAQKRWEDGLYLDTPQEWDDPYRFFRW